LPQLSSTATTSTFALSVRDGIPMANAPAVPFGKHDTRLLHDTTPSINRNVHSSREAPHWNPRFTMHLARSPLATTTTYDNGGQTGIEIGGGNNYIGIYANNTAYQPAQVNLQSGNDPVNPFNTLYAPTMKGSDGSCLENGTDYWRYMTDGVASTFRIYDFCTTGAGFVLSKDINATFVAAYLRYFPGANVPQYTTEIKLMPDGKWHSLLYNYTLGAYEDLYSVAGGNYYNGGMGWSIFETHYAVGPCSTPPLSVSSSILVESANGTWTPITPANSDSTYNWGTCFTSTEGNPYSVKTVSNNGSMWSVTSLGQPPAPLSSYAQTIVNDAPAAYYRLGDSGTTAVDSSGMSPAIPGTYGSAVARGSASLLATETTNAAARFAGGASTATNVVSAPPASRLQPSQQVSIETWMRIGGTNSGTVDLVSYGPESAGQAYTIQLLPNGTTGAFITTSTGYGFVTGTAVLAPGRAYLLDATYDGATLSVYVDGMLDGSAHVTGTLNYSKVNATNGLSIGSAFSSTRQTLMGSLDEVAIFPSTLSATQIGNHWTAGSGLPVASGTSLYASTIAADGPAAFYRLSDTTSAAVDASGNGITGTYGSAVKRGVAGLLPADIRNNGARFPGGTSSNTVAVTASRNAKLEPAQMVSLESWLQIAAAPSGTVDLVSYGPEALGQPYTLQLLSNRTIAMFGVTTRSYVMLMGHTALGLNTPHLVDATYDGTMIAVYVDGKLDASAAASGALNYSKVTTTYGLSIGTAFDTSRSAFVGELDDVAIYPKALSATSVASHWAVGTGADANP
jgi:hypothetical protein